MRKQQFSRTIVLALFALTFYVSIPADAQTRQRRPAGNLSLAQKIRPSIVTLTAMDSAGRNIVLGSGFFVQGNLIATSYSLIKDKKGIKAKVFGQQRAFPASDVFMKNEDSDIALLRIPASIGRPLPFLSSTAVVIGDGVYFTKNSATAGSTLQKGILTGTYIESGKCYARVSPYLTGAGGSPVLTTRGEVIAMLVESAWGDKDHGLAVPIKKVLRLIPPIKTITGGVPGGVPGGIPGPVGDRETEKDCFTGMTTVIDSAVWPPDAPPPPPPPPIRKLPSPSKAIRKSGSVLAGEALYTPQPAYPPLAKAARVSGAVVVEITIDEQGNVISAVALTGHPLLKDAAISAAQRWRFRPTLLSGVPVKVIGTLTFNFNL